MSFPFRLADLQLNAAGRNQLSGRGPIAIHPDTVICAKPDYFSLAGAKKIQSLSPLACRLTDWLSVTSLLTDTEFLNQATIAFNIFVLQIFQQAAPLTNHFQQTAP